MIKEIDPGLRFKVDKEEEWEKYMIPCYLQFPIYDDGDGDDPDGKEEEKEDNERKE